MIAEVITYLDLYLKPLGFRTLGLASQVLINDVKFPATYLKEGEFKAINPEVNTIFHRIVQGPVTEREDGSIGCSEVQKRTYRIRLFASFDRDLICQDNPNGIDTVLSNFNRLLNNRSIKAVKQAFGLNLVTTYPTLSYREKEAWDLEFGSQYDGSMGFVAVDYTVELKGELSCFEIIGCNGEPVDILQRVIDMICPTTAPVCEDVTVNVNGSLFDTAEAGNTVNVPVIDSEGDPVTTQIVGGNVVIPSLPCPPCDDASVTVNSEAYGTVASGGTLNVVVVDTNDDPVDTTISGGKVIIDDLPCAAPVAGAALPLKTGQTVIAEPNDDGANQIGRDVDWFTLDYVNPWGHTYRWTGLGGGYVTNPLETNSLLVDWRNANGTPSTEATVVTNNIIIDWASLSRDGTKVIMWYIVPDLTFRTFAAAMAQQSTISIGSYTSGWKTPNSNIGQTIVFGGRISHALTWYPMTKSSGTKATDLAIMWLSSEQGTSTSLAKTLAFSSTNPTIGNLAKTSTRPQGLYCRIGTVSGTTIT